MVIVIYFIMVTQQSKNCSPRPFFEIFQLTAKFNAFQLRSLLQQHVVSKWVPFKEALGNYSGILLWGQRDWLNSELTSTLCSLVFRRATLTCYHLNCILVCCLKAHRHSLPYLIHPDDYSRWCICYNTATITVTIPYIDSHDDLSHCCTRHMHFILSVDHAIQIGLNSCYGSAA